MDDAELWARYEALDSREDALAALDEIIERLRRGPMSAKLAYALKERGLILANLERPVEAKSTFEEARMHEALLDPTSRFYLLMGLGDAHDTLGDLDAAIRVLTAAVEASTIFDASSEEAVCAQLALGAAYTDADRFDDAERVYRAILVSVVDPTIAGQVHRRLDAVLDLRRLTR